MGGYVIVSEIGSQITFIRDNLPIKKSDLLLKKPIPIFYMIVIWLEKVWLVHKSAASSLSDCASRPVACSLGKTLPTKCTSSHEDDYHCCISM